MGSVNNLNTVFKNHDDRLDQHEDMFGEVKER
jgi:hypothetical protein